MQRGASLAGPGEGQPQAWSPAGAVLEAPRDAHWTPAGRSYLRFVVYGDSFEALCLIGRRAGWAPGDPGARRTYVFPRCRSAFSGNSSPQAYLVLLSARWPGPRRFQVGPDVSHGCPAPPEQGRALRMHCLELLEWTETQTAWSWARIMQAHGPVLSWSTGSHGPSAPNLVASVGRVRLPGPGPADDTRHGSAPTSAKLPVGPVGETGSLQTEPSDRLGLAQLFPGWRARRPPAAVREMSPRGSLAAPAVLATGMGDQGLA